MALISYGSAALAYEMRAVSYGSAALAYEMRGASCVRSQGVRSRQVPLTAGAGQFRAGQVRSASRCAGRCDPRERHSNRAVGPRVPDLPQQRGTAREPRGAPLTPWANMRGPRQVSALPEARGRRDERGVSVLPLLQERPRHVQSDGATVATNKGAGGGLCECMYTLAGPIFRFPVPHSPCASIASYGTSLPQRTFVAVGSGKVARAARH